MRFIFINRFYWPDEPATAQLLTDLAEKLVEHGHAVTVITGRSADPSARGITHHRGVEIRRTGLTPGERARVVAKLAAFFSFSGGALVQLVGTVQRGDIVVSLTDPPLLGIGAWLVARLKRARIFHWVQDIYPEVAIAVTGHAWLAIFRPARNLAWRRSDGCIALGSDLAATIQRSGVPDAKITISPNWAPTGLTPQPAEHAATLRADWNLTGKFVALYSGNLGRVHELEALLDVAAHLRAHPHIVVVFVGAGAQLASLTDIVARRGLPNVRFYPPQPRGRLSETLALGNVHFVTLRAGCESAVFPSKLHGLAAVGRPAVVIASRESELARVVVTHGFGRAFLPTETEMVAEHIIALSRSPEDCARMAGAAQQFAESTGGADRAAREWAALAEGRAGP